MKGKHFPHYWLFVRGIHWWPVDSPHIGQWHRALMFSLICAWINCWANNRDTCEWRCHGALYGVTVMMYFSLKRSLVLLEINEILHIENKKMTKSYQPSVKVSICALKALAQLLHCAAILMACCCGKYVHWQLAVKYSFVFLLVCISIYMYMYIYINIYIHTHIYIYACIENSVWAGVVNCLWVQERFGVYFQSLRSNEGNKHQIITWLCGFWRERRSIFPWQRA